MNIPTIMAKGGKGGAGGSAKGGGGKNPNFPSRTGKPSGEGRGNNPSKK